MATERPTDAAIASFKRAASEAKQAAGTAVSLSGSGSPPSGDQPYNVQLAQSIQMVAEGLANLSVGLRAVYLAIEELKLRSPR